jgi:hypothetical protein
MAIGLGTPELEALGRLPPDAPSEQATLALRAALHSLGVAEPPPEALTLRHAAHLCAEGLTSSHPSPVETSLIELHDLWAGTRLTPLARWGVLYEDLHAANDLKSDALTEAVLAEAGAEMERWAGALVQLA